AGEPQEEADDEIRPRRAADVESDRAHERGHPQRPQDHADGTSEDTDEERENAAAQYAETFAHTWGDRAKGEIDSTPRQDCGDDPVENADRHLVREERAGDRAGDGGRSHPRDDVPVDPSLASVPEAARTRRRCRDGNVRSRCLDRIPVARTISGRRRVPSTRPSIEPR